MNKRTRQTISMIALVGTVLLISACATTSVNLVDNGTIVVDIVNTDRSEFYSVAAHQDDGDLVISGYMKRSHGTFSNLVDVKIIDKNGVVLQRSESTLHRVSKMNRGKHHFSFSTRFSVEPHAGTTVQIQLQRDGHDSDGGT